MSAKHTPGPWISEVGEVCCVRAQQDGGRIALMANLKGQFGLSGRRNASEVVANASLIAAAPDLLDALQWLVDLMPDPELDRDPVQREFVIKAKAVILKATGGKA